MNPEIVVISSQLDLDLTELLGDKPADFLILCLDGKPLDGFGTPCDSPEARETKQCFVDHLNDRSKNSWWPKFLANWRRQIVTQFELTAENYLDFRPFVSWRIHRVCCGHSAHLHCAIRLFEEEKVKSLIARWTVGINKHALVEIHSVGGRRYVVEQPGEPLSFVIGKAVKWLLTEENFLLEPK